MAVTEADAFFYQGHEMENASIVQRCANDSLMSETGECVSILPTNDSCNNSNNSAYDRNPYIMPWYLQTVYFVVFVAIVIVGTFGNLIVIWIVLAHKRMRTVTNYFLVNLATADALMSVCNTLFNFVYMVYSDWPFGRTYCKFSLFIGPCTICASVFTLMAIAVDRYMAIIHPLRPRMKAGTVLAVIAVIWLLSCLCTCPQFFFGEVYEFHYCSGGDRVVCYVNWPDGIHRSTFDFWYTLFLMLVDYFIPLLALSVTYLRVGCELWGSQAIGERTKRQEETIRSKRKVVKMMIIVVVIFAVCWLPQHVYFVVVNRNPDTAYELYIQHVYLVIYWMAMSNSMYNPIIYCWMNARFRMGFKYVFRWLPCVDWRPNEHVPNPKSALTTARSMSETTMTTKFERNGSALHTMMESMDETSYGTSSSALYSHGHRPPPYSVIRMRNEQEFKRQAEDSL